jgi:hypothetical protein
MLGSFFRRSTYEKQRVNKEQNLEIGSAASSGRQEKFWLPLASAWGSTSNFFILVSDKKSAFIRK